MTATGQPRAGADAPAAPDAPAGLYLHIPFCAHICPYCDFNTYAGQEGLIPRYVEALSREIVRQSGRLAGREIASVFLGGGTPSLLAPRHVSALIEAVRAAGNLTPDAEITLEANPNGVGPGEFAGWREAGVNRLSIGIQTFSQRGLRRLGRLHEAADARRAIDLARAAGFASVSADFIFGWPGQQPADWEQDLAEIAATESLDHVSLYSLIVEPGTPMADAVARNVLAVPDDDAAAELYERAIERLASAGWIHYEVANWARHPAAMSRHNRLYWRNGDFVGAGAGAHGTVRGDRWMNHPLPKTYMEAVESGADPAATCERIDPRTAMGETMMLGLRLLIDGVDEEAFALRHGLPLRSAFGSELDRLETERLIVLDGSAVRLTRRGLMLANDVCARFL
ncbi:MAG: radical SAM family heme chaperone HemW [Chloroflexota bacterium]